MSGAEGRRARSTDYYSGLESSSPTQGAEPTNTLAALVSFALDSSRVGRIEDLPQKQVALLIEELIRVAEISALERYEVHRATLELSARMSDLKKEFESLEIESTSKLEDQKRLFVTKSELYVAVLGAIGAIVLIVVGIQQMLGD